MNKSRIVIDTSFLLKMFLPEEKSDEAEERWRGWIEDSIEVVAPTLIVFEASSVLRNKVYRGILGNDDAREMVDQVRYLELTLVYTEDLLNLGSLRSLTFGDCPYLRT